jgi:hypothetical protein
MYKSLTEEGILFFYDLLHSIMNMLVIYIVYFTVAETVNFIYSNHSIDKYLKNINQIDLIIPMYS